MISTVSSNYANTVAPFAPLGRQVVGQETADLKASTFKALEQSANSARNENRRSPDDKPNEQGESQRVRGAQSGDTQQSDKAAAEKERTVEEQKLINELAAVDREVHAHEQAHAAVAGQYAGRTTYQFVKGPDGLSYAVGGEVSISTGAVPNDPEATLRKAQQIRQAANAPADPSSQDRRVAAEATQLENQARAELNIRDAAEAQEQQQRYEQKIEFQKSEAEKEASVDEAKRKEARLEQDRQDAENARRTSDNTDLLARLGKANINISQRLVEIGAVAGSSAIGTFLNQEV